MTVSMTEESFINQTGYGEVGGWSIVYQATADQLIHDNNKHTVTQRAPCMPCVRVLLLLSLLLLRKRPPNTVACSHAPAVFGVF